MSDIVTSTPIIVLPKRKTLWNDTRYTPPLNPRTNFQNLVIGTAKITTAMIADLAVTNAQIADLVATKITGQIVNAQIATIDFAKITDVEITNAHIISLDAGKITSQIVDAQIANIAFAKITNVIITNAHITSLAVSKITAGTLSAVITLSGSIAVTGSITGGGGAVILDASGLRVVGQFLSIRYSAGSVLGSIYASAADTMTLACTGKISIVPTGELRLKTALPSIGSSTLGSVAAPWYSCEVVYPHFKYFSIRSGGYIYAETNGIIDIGNTSNYFGDVYAKYFRPPTTGGFILRTVAAAVAGSIKWDGAGGIYVHDGSGWRHIT